MQHKINIIYCLKICLSFSQQTPMHTAAKHGNIFTMEGLVELGADINIKDNNGVNNISY